MEPSATVNTSVYDSCYSASCLSVFGVTSYHQAGGDDDEDGEEEGECIKTFQIPHVTSLIILQDVLLQETHTPKQRHNRQLEKGQSEFPRPSEGVWFVAVPSE